MHSLSFLASPRAGKDVTLLGIQHTALLPTDRGILENLMLFFRNFEFYISFFGLVWGTGFQLSSLGWLVTPLAQVGFELPVIFLPQPLKC